ncbi:ribonuclease H-like domain-containing protein [Tanacetum coccineum]
MEARNLLETLLQEIVSSNIEVKTKKLSAIEHGSLGYLSIYMLNWPSTGISCLLNLLSSFKMNGEDVNKRGEANVIEYSDGMPCRILIDFMMIILLLRDLHFRTLFSVMYFGAFLDLYYPMCGSLACNTLDYVLRIDKSRHKYPLVIRGRRDTFIASKFTHWTDVMNDEMDALLRHDTWEIIELPKDRKAIGIKWVFKIKYKSTGEIDRYKERLVAKGFNQKEGVDFEETFFPVVKMVTVRCLLNFNVLNCWPIFQLDVNNAFLDGDLAEIVYMKPLEGYFSTA